MRMTTLTRRGTRRRVVVCTVVAIGAVAMASTAWACTVLMGTTTLVGAKTTTAGIAAGPAGSIVKVKATGLKTRDFDTGEPLATPAVYRIEFTDPQTFATLGDRCHTSGSQLMEKKNPDGSFSPANDIAAPPDPNDPAQQNGAFKVKVRIPLTRANGDPTPTGKSKICGTEVSPAFSESGTTHPTFKVTLV